MTYLGSIFGLLSNKLRKGFGINSTSSYPYVTVDRVNYYLNTATGAFADDLANSETRTYIARVVADGGYVVDPYVVDRAYSHAKNNKYYTDLFAWLIPGAGVKLETTNGITYVRKFYDLSSKNNDVNQSVDAGMGVFTLSKVNNKSAVYFNGTTTFYSFSSPANAETNNISALYAHAIINTPVNGTRKTLLSINTNSGSSASRANIELGRTGTGILEFGGRRLDANSYAYAASVANTLVNDTWTSVSGLFDYANAKAYVWKNGSNVAYNSSFQTAGNTSATNSGMNIRISGGTAASGSIGSNPLSGYLAEIMLMKNESNPPIEFINERIASEYGISVAGYNNTLLAEGNYILTLEEV